MALDITTLASTDKLSDSRGDINTNFTNIATDLDALSDDLENLTDGEVTQLEAIGATTISAAQWAYLGDLDQALKKASSITFADLTLSGLTASELTATDASKKLQSLAVATYPSLTEISYIKGLTSAIQTQLSGKAAVDQTMYIGTTGVAINRTTAALTLAGLTLTTPNLGTPSAGTLTNCTFPTLNQNTTGTAANLSGTPTLPNGTLATTQGASDNSTKLATTAYVDAAGGGGGATQLSELSDVVSATNTDKFALMANGTTGYVGRALVEADISNLGSYITISSSDTLTNKTIDGDVNTLSDIAVSSLKEGTDGQLITWGTNAEPTTVATGDNDQVLTSNGAGAAPTFQDAAAGLWEVDGTETQLKTADEIDMRSKKIINLLDPTANQDAATKKYVDDEIKKFAIKRADNTILAQSDGVVYQSTTSYVKVKDISIDRLGGTCNVVFELYNTGGGSTVARIYKNGSPVGTEESEGNSGWNPEIEEDISFVAGDNIQLYLKSTTAGQNQACRNFRLKGVIVPAQTIVA